MSFDRVTHLLRSSYQLAVTNPQIDGSCNNLQPGQSICLGYQGQDCQTTYVVKGGDSCDQIVGNHGINSTMLWANNAQINADCTNIYIGEVRNCPERVPEFFFRC